MRADEAEEGGEQERRMILEQGYRTLNEAWTDDGKLHPVKSISSFCGRRMAYNLIFHFRESISLT